MRVWATTSLAPASRGAWPRTVATVTRTPGSRWVRRCATAVIQVVSGTAQRLRGCGGGAGRSGDAVAGVVGVGVAGKGSRCHAPTLRRPRHLSRLAPRRFPTRHWLGAPATGSSPGQEPRTLPGPGRLRADHKVCTLRELIGRLGTDQEVSALPGLTGRLPAHRRDSCPAPAPAPAAGGRFCGRAAGSGLP